MKEFGEISVRSAINVDCERVQKLVFGVLREYGLEPEVDGIDRDLSDIESNYIKRGGLFEIIEDSEGNLLGTVGLYPIDEKTVELRKMYFVKDFRGKGFGKKTLKRMIEKAGELGFKKIYLETASVLKVAIGLYEKFGFQSVVDLHSPRCDKAYYLDI
jgi:putative acetyltransferase